MPANTFSNGGYEKISLLDEFDENDNYFKSAPIPETKTHGSKYEFSVSCSLVTFSRYLI